MKSKFCLAFLFSTFIIVSTSSVSEAQSLGRRGHHNRAPESSRRRVEIDNSSPGPSNRRQGIWDSGSIRWENRGRYSGSLDSGSYVPYVEGEFGNSGSLSRSYNEDPSSLYRNGSYVRDPHWYDRSPSFINDYGTLRGF